MNKALLVGRITKDLELKKTDSGKVFLYFNVAVNRPFTNAQGEREADFVNCVVWGKTAENMATYVGKGSLIGVEGRIQTRNYENQQGTRVYVTEVVAENVQFLESKSSRSGGGVSPSQPKPSSNDETNFFADYSEPNSSSSNILSEINISDDELPF